MSASRTKPSNKAPDAAASAVAKAQPVTQPVKAVESHVIQTSYLQDIETEIRKIEEQIEHNPSRQAELQDRLLLLKAQHKKLRWENVQLAGLALMVMLLVYVAAQAFGLIDNSVLLKKSWAP